MGVIARKDGVTPQNVQRALRKLGVSYSRTIYRNWMYVMETPKYARTAYLKQKAKARARGIDWQFKDFRAWWVVWFESGKWEQRGRSTSQWCMARYGDCGPYSPENVRIATVLENLQERGAVVAARNRASLS